MQELAEDDTDAVTDVVDDMQALSLTEPEDVGDIILDPDEETHAVFE